MTSSHPPRSVWISLAMALPLGLLLGVLLDHLGVVQALSISWLGVDDDASRIRQVLVGLGTHIFAPTMFAFFLLRGARLGTLLAPNRLSLVCLLLADALLVAVVLRGLVLAAMGDMPYLGRAGREAFEPIFFALLGTGGLVLALSTAWHRALVDRARAASVFKWLCAEV